MAWPANPEVLQGIAKTSFYGSLAAEEANRLYTKSELCMPIEQGDLTVTYTSFGNVPEPRLMSPTVAGGGSRQAKDMKDYKLVGTVAEFELTVTRPRAVVETNPGEIPRVTQQMAEKAALFMDRRFVATALPSSTVGYDGVSLYNDAHPESGTNQDNNLTSAAATGTKPTAAELEADLDLELLSLKGFTDDQGTPVNDGVSRYTVIVPLQFEYLYKSVLTPTKAQSPGLDISGGTGRYRGMVDVYASAFVATQDRHYLVAQKGGTAPVALLKNKDWEFKTNIGTDSDLWNYSQTALFYAYARWEFIPWDWKTTLIQVWT